MSAINDGGPVFPGVNLSPDSLEQWRKCYLGESSTPPAPSEGLTIRDYFAAKALPALITQNGSIGVYSAAVTAAESYEYANAMLTAREAK